MSLSAKTIDEVKEICFTSPDYIKSLKKVSNMLKTQFIWKYTHI